jgi:tripartite-type tricarboxylate transporter receptor subunit TctC
MQGELGQPWVIDPRPGANGIMAGQPFLGAPSDGDTLSFTVSGHRSPDCAALRAASLGTTANGQRR